MPDRLTVTSALELPAGFEDEIRALDPRIDLRVRPDLLRHLRRPLEERKYDARAELADTEVLFTFGMIHASHVSGSGSLRWFQVAGAGLDTFIESGGLDLGLQITNSSGVASAVMAEWVLGSMLIFAKGFHHAFQNQREHRWSRWPSGELYGKTVGIIGLGAIGEETARRCRAMGMRVLATKRSAKPGDTHPDADLLLPQSEMGRILDEADYIVLAVPLTAETRHLIGAAELARMKDSAVVVNIARGPVIDQPALLQALRTGQIRGAAIDVTDPEPLPADDPLWDEPNVFICPHISGHFDGHMAGSARLFVRNLRHYLAGEPLENVVDPVLKY